MKDLTAVILDLQDSEDASNNMKHYQLDKQGASAGILPAEEDSQPAQRSSIVQNNVPTTLVGTKEDSPAPPSGSPGRQSVHLNVKTRKYERAPRKDSPGQQNIQTTAQDGHGRLQGPLSGPNSQQAHPSALIRTRAHQKERASENSARTQSAGEGSQTGRRAGDRLAWDYRAELTEDQLVPGTRPMTGRSLPKLFRQREDRCPLEVILETEFMIAPKGLAQLKPTMTAFLQTLVRSYNTENAGGPVRHPQMTQPVKLLGQNIKWIMEGDHSAPPPTRSSPRKFFPS